MKDLRLSDRAQSDMAEIWTYSFETFGAVQAERYIRDIHSVFIALCTGSARWHPADDLRQGYRRARVGSHFVFFVETGDAVEVVRVLHQRMDAGRWV
ncbi:type II toxin-antitoxin system RelE/ParE family toxin [Histidinibacterium lentulum]|uniref:Toxin n=1 Tax=Histidinibacterium lentulum TaxID=2480588 RepID=A0A3N2R1P8_9RHOB|nr:type II toxin-antitoxin system RelE/ParE family toxin [Histidinibacterium lentulum]ROU01236.1 type II toxin-antitoxin system RelE/ParE family toxin [Histidinibacterium lentulum]